MEGPGRRVVQADARGGIQDGLKEDVSIARRSHRRSEFRREGGMPIILGIFICHHCLFVYIFKGSLASLGLLAIWSQIPEGTLGSATRSGLVWPRCE